MRSPSRILVGCIALLGMSLTAQRADAAFCFDNITTNNTSNVAAGEAQLSMVVSDTGSTVTFTLSNIGPAASSITAVYFDDNDSAPLLSGTMSITQSSGVVFSADVNPGNLPGGNSISPAFDTDYSATAVPPPSSNGVNNTPAGQEWVAISFTGDYNAVIAALGTGALRVGIHVQAFGNDGSEAFINCPEDEDEGVDVVPAPAGILLLASAIPVLGLRRLLRRKTA